MWHSFVWSWTALELSSTFEFREAAGAPQPCHSRTYISTEFNTAVAVSLIGLSWFQFGTAVARRLNQCRRAWDLSRVVRQSLSHLIQMRLDSDVLFLPYYSRTLILNWLSSARQSRSMPPCLSRINTAELVPNHMWLDLIQTSRSAVLPSRT